MDHLRTTEPIQMLLMMGKNLIPECSFYTCRYLLHIPHYLKGNIEKKIVNLLIIHD